MKGKYALIFLVLIFILVVDSNMVLSLRDCRLEYRDAITDSSYDALYDELNANYSLMGYVSTQGYYASRLNSSRVLYPWGLFCDNRLNQNRADGAPTFNFSNPNAIVYTHSIFGPVYGSGRVTHSGVGVLFEGEAYHGFGEGKCRLVPSSDSCGSSEVCVLKLSNPNQGSVADCRDGINRPYQNLFQYKICCTPTEICNDGIDNTGDGLVDCASPDCHPSISNFDVPQRCDPHGSLPLNNQTSSDCASVDGDGNLVYAPHCRNGGDSFYCSYGRNDANTEGFCCPAGKFALEDPVNPGSWECLEPTQCGVLPTQNCVFDYRLGGVDRSGWFGSVFSSIGE
ncbi:MAG: hypothetical protein ACLFN8_05405, partial [Candidatus Woesearchaeota archaeon]